MSTTHFERLWSFIGIYCARYVKWGTPDRDGILVLAEQIKQIKIPIFPFPMRWPAQWPTVAVVTVFGICFYILSPPPPAKPPFWPFYGFVFIWIRRPKTYLNAAPHAAGFCSVYFRRTAIICNNRVFATVAVNGGSVLCRSSFWSGIMLSVGGCYIALGVGGGENYSYIWAQSMVQPCPR